MPLRVKPGAPAPRAGLCLVSPGRVLPYCTRAGIVSEYLARLGISGSSDLGQLI